ncbi:MAG TPA: DUF427 domain-containing protein [Devosiaceae bacterium]|jgi:uncharacterized protein (DUF427 family)
MPKQCVDKDIKITASTGRVRVHFNNRIIADTVRALDLDEPGAPLRIYVPLEDVMPEVLAESTHHTHCPYKGEASYYSLQAPDEKAANAVWYYADPCPLVEAIRGHVAFWGNQIRYQRA